MLMTATTILTFASLICAAVSDIRTRSIPDWVNLPVLGCAVLRLIFLEDKAERISTLTLLIVLLVSFTVLTLRDFSALGGGDMKLLLSLSLFCEARMFLTGLLIGCIAALIYGKVRKEERLALAPFFLTGFIVSGVIYFVG